MSIAKRVGWGVVANIYAQVVTVINQIVLTPLYFRIWGPQLYGEWLILSSVPAYLVMADLGLGQAAGNDMTMRTGAGDYAGAQRTFRGAIFISIAASALVIAIGAVLGGISAMVHIPRTILIPAYNAGIIIALLSINVALGFQGGVIFAGFRSSGYNALAIASTHTSRLLEAVAMAVALLLRQTPIVVCLAALATKAAFLVAQHLALRRISPWLFTPAAGVDRDIVRRLLKPSLGFLALPLGFALTLQGPILIIGGVMGAHAVAIFSALRTLTRLPIQLANAISYSIWPEFSRAHGAGDIGLVRTLHRGNWAVTVPLVAGSSIGLLVLGPAIVRLWLGPEVVVDRWMLAGLLLVTILGAMWGASSVVLSAINAHAGFGLRYILISAACVAAAWPLTANFGWTGLLTCLILSEFLVLMWVFPKVLKTTQDTFAAFIMGTAEGLRQMVAKVARRSGKRVN